MIPEGVVRYGCGKHVWATWYEPNFGPSHPLCPTCLQTGRPTADQPGEEPDDPKPRLLDLFCGAGGAAKGYADAGFEVVGVDIKPQPNYPFEFVQADALGAMYEHPDLREVDAIHASPPCQYYANVTAWRGDQDDHPDLIGPTRELLEAKGLPYVIENVRTKALRDPFMLCGTQFGLPIRRHRYFESNSHPFVLTTPCQHHPDDYSFDHGGKQPESVYRDAMGVPWMTVQESREAIPPLYTKYIGGYLLSHLQAVEKAA